MDAAARMPIEDLERATQPERADAAAVLVVELVAEELRMGPCTSQKNG